MLIIHLRQLLLILQANLYLGNLYANGSIQAMSGNSILANGPSNFNGNIGDGSPTSGQSWGAVWTNYLEYHTSYNSHFDWLQDDLSYAKSYKTTKVLREHPLTHEKKECGVIDMQASFPFLLDENGFMHVGDFFGYTMGCLKQSALKHDEHDAKLESILGEVEDLRTQVQALKTSKIAS